MNQNGHPATLVASHPGNANNGRHGVYSPRVVAPRARELVDAFMSLPHLLPLDRIAAEEAASLVARLEAIDRDLDERGHFSRRGGGGARDLLSHRARLSRELRAWLVELGATPKTRADRGQAFVVLRLLPASRRWVYGVIDSLPI